MAPYMYDQLLHYISSSSETKCWLAITGKEKAQSTIDPNNIGLLSVCQTLTPRPLLWSKLIPHF